MSYQGLGLDMVITSEEAATNACCEVVKIMCQKIHAVLPDLSPAVGTTNDLRYLFARDILLPLSSARGCLMAQIRTELPWFIKPDFRSEREQEQFEKGLPAQRAVSLLQIDPDSIVLERG